MKICKIIHIDNTHWITLSVFVISDKLLTTNVHDIPRLLPNV